MARKKYCRIPTCDNNRGGTGSEIRLFKYDSVYFIFGCGNKISSFSILRMPVTNTELRIKWEQAIKYLFDIDARSHQVPLLCSDHFDPNDMMMKRGGYALKPGAIPCIVGRKLTVKTYVKILYFPNCF